VRQALASLATVVRLGVTLAALWSIYDEQWAGVFVFCCLTALHNELHWLGHALEEKRRRRGPRTIEPFAND
jgi:hypothetical protein